MERRDRLVGQMREGQLASICRVVRDMTNYKRSNKLNDQSAHPGPGDKFTGHRMGLFNGCVR